MQASSATSPKETSEATSANDTPMQAEAEPREPPVKRQRTAASLVVGWFRNDLRLRDNPLLEAVLAQAQKDSLPALLVYILDPRFYDRSEYGRVTDPELKNSIPARKAPG